MELPEALRELLDKQAIYELLCRYCRGIDRLDRELVLSCYWPGTKVEHVGPGGDGELNAGTVEQFLDNEWDSWGKYAGSMHYIANHLCEVAGDRAQAETYQFSTYWGEPTSDQTLNFTSSNRYIDDFERRNGEWRVSGRRLLRNWTKRETRPVDLPKFHEGWPMSRQDRNDPAYRTLK